MKQELASVHTDAEADALHQAVKELTGTSNPEYWLGASDAATEGTWSWSNGLPFVFQRWDRSTSPVQPSNGTGENCLMVTGNATWSDDTCSSTRIAICGSGKPCTSSLVDPQHDRDPCSYIAKAV